MELSPENLDRRNYKLDVSGAPGVQAPSSITPYLNPDPYAVLGYTKIPNLNALAKGDTVAVYAQDQLDLTPQWKALIGIRYEHYKSEAQTRALSPEPTAAPVGPFSRTDTYWSGRAGLIGTDQQQCITSRTGTPTTVRRAWSLWRHRADHLNAINANLDPEQSRNFEVARSGSQNWVQLRAAIFRNEKTNARYVDPRSARRCWGQARVMESSRGKRIDSPNWDVYSGIALMDGEIIQGVPAVIGKTPLGVANVAGNVWTVYRFLPGWEIGGGLRGQDGTWLTDANQPNSQIPSYVVVDLTAAYIQPQYEIRINAYNITDKTYYYGGYENRPDRVLPGMPRATHGLSGIRSAESAIRRTCCCKFRTSDPDEVARIRQRIDNARWVDGNVTSGHQSAQAKYNEQLPRIPTSRASRRRDRDRARAEPAVFSAALPKTVYPPLSIATVPG